MRERKEIAPPSLNPCFSVSDLETPLGLLPESTYWPQPQNGWPPFRVYGDAVEQIDSLRLSTRAANALKRAAINLPKLVSLSQTDKLHRLRNIGPPSVQEISYRLELLKSLLKQEQEKKPGNLMLLIFTEDQLSIIPGPPLWSIKLSDEMPFLPPYQIKPPRKEEGLSDLDSLINLGFLTDTRTIKALKEGSVETIPQLKQILSREISVRGVGRKGEEKISQSLEEFEELVKQKFTQAPNEVPVIIEVPTLRKRGFSKREREWLQRWAGTIRFIMQWQKDNPGKKGALNAAAREFGLTGERVRQIVKKFREITHRPEVLEPKQLELPVEEVVNLIKAWQEENPGVTGARAAAVRELGIPYYLVARCIRLYEEKTGESLRKQELTLEQRIKIKEERLMLKPPEEAMNYFISHEVTRRHLYSRLVIPLSVIARQAGITNLREISKVFAVLEASKEETGFIVRRIGRRFKGRRAYYYYLHFSQREAILSWLLENYTFTPSRVQF